MSNQGHDMSQIKYSGENDHSDTTVAIVVSKWNPAITEALYSGAVQTLVDAGVLEENIYRLNVPGSYELPQGARIALQSDPDLSGVICLGCVIQGETKHFDFICQSCADGVMRVSLDYSTPVIFGVLTPNTDQQAADRAGGKLGNKGEEAAVACLEMIDLSFDFPPDISIDNLNGFLGLSGNN
jgi:6,7-dimethyl-8-ribityllumazine synthase